MSHIVKNDKIGNWNIIVAGSEEVEFPDFDKEVFIIVENDYFDNDGIHDSLGELYFPKTFRAVLKKGKFGIYWVLIFEPDENEQIVLQSETVVAWRYVY